MTSVEGMLCMIFLRRVDKGEYNGEGQLAASATLRSSGPPRNRSAPNFASVLVVLEDEVCARVRGIRR